MSQIAYNYVELSPPSLTEEFVTGINDAGQIVGWGDGPGPDFLYSGGEYIGLLARASALPPASMIKGQ